MRAFSKETSVLSGPHLTMPMAEKEWSIGLPGMSTGEGGMDESLDTRRCSLSNIVLELEGTFWSRRIELDRLGPPLLMESSDELLKDRNALVRVLGALASTRSACSTNGSYCCAGG